MRSLTLAMIATAALFAPGCWGHVGYSATVSNDGYGPDLVYAAPGVQVIADWDEPIFYADNFYWRFYGGGWYRSPYYTGGWVYARPPVAVMRIDRPHAYVHYRPAGWADRRQRGGRQPVAREYRDDRSPSAIHRGEPVPRPVYQQPPAPPAQQMPRAMPPPQQAPRAAPQAPRAAPPAQQAPRAAPQGQRGRERHDDGHRDHH